MTSSLGKRVFLDSSIGALVELLSNREASLYHTCQLNDLPSYLALGGIPSHAHLEAHQAAYTAMDTDAIDKTNGVWDKVFVNLTDFGRAFARGRVAPPCAYGPITLQLHPAALLEADDVAICLRSAGAQGFDRTAESLQSVDDVDRLFLHAADSTFPHNRTVRYGPALRAVFPDAVAPEVSCTVPSGRLGWEQVIVVWVDAYSFAGAPLVEQVRSLLSVAHPEIPAHLRSCCTERRTVYNELAVLALDACYTADAILARPAISAELRDLVQQLRERELDYQLDRCLRYLRAGTLTTVR